MECEIFAEILREVEIGHCQDEAQKEKVGRNLKVNQLKEEMVYQRCLGEKAWFGPGF